MFSEYEMFARIPGGAAVAIRFDGKGFITEVGFEGDPGSFEPVEYHDSFEQAAFGAVSIVKFTSIVSETDHSIPVVSDGELYSNASYRVAQGCVVIPLR
jgi:hypothetical protein